jgi:hypothetical protein
VGRVVVGNAATVQVDAVRVEAAVFEVGQKAWPGTAGWPAPTFSDEVPTGRAIRGGLGQLQPFQSDRAATSRRSRRRLEKGFRAPLDGKGYMSRVNVRAA